MGKEQNIPERWFCLACLPKHVTKPEMCFEQNELPCHASQHDEEDIPLSESSDSWTQFSKLNLACKQPFFIKGKLSRVLHFHTFHIYYFKIAFPAKQMLYFLKQAAAKCLNSQGSAGTHHLLLLSPLFNTKLPIVQHHFTGQCYYPVFPAFIFVWC